LSSSRQPIVCLSYTLEGKPLTVAVHATKAVLGRDPSCDVVFPSNSVGVSRRHAVIAREGSGWSITDVGSQNGTRVNGVPITAQSLHHRDLINLGRLEVTFLLDPPPVPEAWERVQFEESDSSSRPAASIIKMRDIDSALTGGSQPGLRLPIPASPSPDKSFEIKGLGLGVIDLFSQVAEALLGGENLDDMLGKILELVFKNLPAERGLLCLYDQSTDTITPKVVRSRDGIADEKISISRSIANEVIKSKKAVLVGDALSDQRFQAKKSILTLGIRSAMAAPMYHSGNVIGFIYTDTHNIEQPFREEHLQVLTVLAVLSAVGIEQARLREEIVHEQHIRARLARYSSPGVVEKIVKEAGTSSADMVAEERVVSVCFCDLCGFTSMSENMAPADVARTLNEIFERFVELIFSFDGTLDKYTGDGLIAVFGAPVTQSDHAERAVRTALLMQRELEELNRRHADRRPLAMRIGISSGPVTAGDIGSPRRKDYTVVGDTVNVASRLESMVAKPGQVVIGPTTYDMVKTRFTCHPLAPIQLKGKNQLVQPYLVSAAAHNSGSILLRPE
jgi:adenylate cyclase